MTGPSDPTNDAEPIASHAARSVLPGPVPARVWLFIVAVFLAFVAGFGMWRIQREYPSHWARILPQVAVSESLQIDLQKALQQISDTTGPEPGARLPLAEFVQSNGSRVRIVLVPGQFYDRSIEPVKLWRALGSDVLLVTSVDERRSGEGSLSSPITAGCAIPPEEDVAQELGSTSISECHGIYRNLFHINRVARLSAIVETSFNSSESPCWARYGITAPEGDYQTCVGNAVASGLRELFSEINTRRTIDALVLPAIGTGVGKLSKAGFYNKLFVDTLVPLLSRDLYIPPTVYLQVPSWDPDSRWPETKIAIAGALATAVTTWESISNHESPDSELLSLTGVAIGSCLMLVALALGARFRILSDLLPVVVQFRPLLVISWISAAVGLVSVLKVFVTFFPANFNPYLHVITGILTAFLCGPLLRAGRTVDDMFKSDRPAISGASDGNDDSSAEKATR